MKNIWAKLDPNKYYSIQNGLFLYISKWGSVTLATDNDISLHNWDWQEFHEGKEGDCVEYARKFVEKFIEQTGGEVVEIKTEGEG